MLRTFRYPLQPTVAQGSILFRWLNLCCTLYNAALEQRRDVWKRFRRNLSLYDQQADLTDLRQGTDYAELPIEVCRSPLRRASRAYLRATKALSRKERASPPRFKAASRYRSFDIPAGVRTVWVDADRVYIPRLGLVRFRRYRDLKGRLKEVRIFERLGRWWIDMVCDVGLAPALRPPARTVGIDVGLEAYGTLSTGERIENPRWERVDHGREARLQRALEGKQSGSQSRARAALRLGRARERVRNRRMDFIRKTVAILVGRFDLIAIEALTISNMKRVGGGLARSIGDASWGAFRRQLESKAEEAGVRVVAVSPGGTSSTCSGCGAVRKKRLDERVHSCECGLVLHRDLNAARNILALGVSAVQLAEDRMVGAQENSAVSEVC